MKGKRSVRVQILIVAIMLFVMSQVAFSADNISYDTYLINSLNDDNVGRRASAAKLLGERNVNSAVQPLMKMLKSDKDFRVRIVAAVSLYKLCDTSVIRSLKAIRKKEKNKTVQHVLNGIILELQNQVDKSLIM